MIKHISITKHPTRRTTIIDVVHEINNDEKSIVRSIYEIASKHDPNIYETLKNIINTFDIVKYQTFDDLLSDIFVFRVSLDGKTIIEKTKDGSVWKP